MTDYGSVIPISEAEARELLLQAHSEASNPNYFDAERRGRGWVFGWREGSRRAPIGTHTWIVADNGRVKMLSPTDDIDTVIDSEAAK
jgi:hypothetical protein